MDDEYYSDFIWDMFMPELYAILSKTRFELWSTEARIAFRLAEKRDPKAAEEFLKTLPK